jgi:hypothetical protein
MRNRFLKTQGRDQGKREGAFVLALQNIRKVYYTHPCVVRFYVCLILFQYCDKNIPICRSCRLQVYRRRNSGSEQGPTVEFHCRVTQSKQLDVRRNGEPRQRPRSCQLRMLRGAASTCCLVEDASCSCFLGLLAWAAAANAASRCCQHGAAHICQLAQLAASRHTLPMPNQSAALSAAGSCSLF